MKTAFHLKFNLERNIITHHSNKSKYFNIKKCYTEDSTWIKARDTLKIWTESLSNKVVFLIRALNFSVICLQNDEMSNLI